MVTDRDAALIEQLAAIEQMHAVKRLLMNKDFINVFLQGYGETYVNNIVANLALCNSESELISHRQLLGVSLFKQYIANLTDAGEKALTAKTEANFEE